MFQAQDEKAGHLQRWARKLYRKSRAQCMFRGLAGCATVVYDILSRRAECQQLSQGQWQHVLSRFSPGIRMGNIKKPISKNGHSCGSLEPKTYKRSGKMWSDLYHRASEKTLSR
jgi:hypothetical protein